MRGGYSFDHLVGDQQDVTVDRQSHVSRSLHVDDQLELGRPLDRQVPWLRPFKYLVYIGGGAPEQIVEVRSVGHQASGVHELPRLIHPRQAAGVLHATMMSTFSPTSSAASA